MSDPLEGVRPDAPPPPVWQTPAEQQTDLIRQRQLARAKVMALILGALVVLIFAIAIAKMGLRH